MIILSLSNVLCDNWVGGHSSTGTGSGCKSMAVMFCETQTGKVWYIAFGSFFNFNTFLIWVIFEFG
jgi:hypothetical protein